MSSCHEHEHREQNGTLGDLVLGVFVPGSLFFYSHKDSQQQEGHCSFREYMGSVLGASYGEIFKIGMYAFVAKTLYESIK